MPQLWDFEQGVAAEIPEAGVSAALRTGRYGLREPDVDHQQKVRVVGPDGRHGSVHVESLVEVLDKGFHLESEKEAVEQEKRQQLRSEDDPTLRALSGLRTGIMGAASTASLGLLPQAITAGEKAIFGTEHFAEEQRLRKEEHPGEYIAGQIAGAISPTGAGGLIQRAGAGVGAKVAGAGATATKKVLGAAARGATEGALFGAGELLTEEAIGSADFSAEAIATHVGGGMLVGGGLGAVFGGVAEGGKAVLKTVAKKAPKLTEAVESFTDDRRLSALGLTGANRKRLAQKTIGGKRLLDKASKTLKEVKHPDGDAIIKFGTAGKNAERLGDVVEGSGKQIGKFVDDLDTAMASAGEAAPISTSSIAKRIRGKILPKYKDKIPLKSTVKKIEEWVDDFDQAEPWTFGQAQEQRRAWGKQAWEKTRVGEYSNADVLRSIERIINDELEAVAKPLAKKHLGAEAFGGFKKAKDTYASLTELAGLSENRAVQMAGNRWISLTDTITGAAAMGGSGATGLGAVGAGATGIVAALAHKAMRELGPSAAVVATERITRLRAVQSVVRSVERNVDDGVKGFLSGKAPAGAPKTTGATVILLNAAFPTGSKAGGIQEAAKKVASNLQDSVAVPETMSEQIAAQLAPLEEVAPNISGQTALHSLKVAQFLEAKAPKTNKQTSLTPLADDWKPSEWEAARFARYYAAATNPLSALEDMKKGTLTPEAAEVLRDLYPRLRDRITQAVMEQAAARTKVLPYKDRVQLSILMGVPVDDTLRPAFIAASQEAHRASGQQRGEGGGGVRLTGLDKIENDKHKTRTQLLEERAV